ncbi:MAG TPA: hypothetical protein PJ991_05030 [Kiritimatiellia bacterium]|nr:hypothetical protein [Kiritimatiellia bacterium]
MASETATAEIATAQIGMIFELEGAAVNGRASLYEAAKNVFQKAGITLSHSQFARHCNQGSATGIINKLIEDVGNDKLPDDAAEAIQAEYTTLIQQGVKLHPLFSNLLKEAANRGMAIAAISVLPEIAATTVFEKSGLAGQGVILHTFEPGERHFPRVDCWMKICRQVVRNPRACVAIAGSRDAGRAALSSGMRCLILPDAFTSYQDFSGADLVLENFDDYSPADVFSALS